MMKLSFYLEFVLQKVFSKKTFLPLRYCSLIYNNQGDVALQAFLIQSFSGGIFQVSKLMNTQCAEENSTKRSNDKKLLYKGLMGMRQGFQRYFFKILETRA